MTVNDTIYKESYFKSSPFFHEEVPVSRLGVMGDSIPYSIANDSLITMALVFCILVSMLTVARSWRLIHYQTKELFRTPRANSVELRESADEMRYQWYFGLQGVILLGILAYSTAVHYTTSEFVFEHYAMLGIYSAIFAIYYIVHEILTLTVHTVFFKKKQRYLDNISRLYFMAMQGALLLPLVLLHVYFHLNIETTLKLAIAVLGVPLLLQAYKVYNIFFRKNNAVVQFFLYFASLEAVPLSLLVGTLIYASIYLTQNI